MRITFDRHNSYFLILILFLREESKPRALGEIRRRDSSSHSGSSFYAFSETVIELESHNQTQTRIFWFQLSISILSRVSDVRSPLTQNAQTLGTSFIWIHSHTFRDCWCRYMCLVRAVIGQLHCLCNF